MSQPPGWDPNQNPYGQGGPSYGQNPQYPGQQPPQGPPPGPYGPPQGPPSGGFPQQGPPQQGPPHQGPPSGPPGYGPPPGQYGPPQFEQTQQLPPYAGPEPTQQLPQPPFGPPPGMQGPGGPGFPGGPPPGYLGPPMPPPKRSNRAPLLIALAVLLIGGLTAGIIVLTKGDKNDTNLAGNKGSSTATATATISVPPLPSDPETSATTDSSSPTDSTSPTETGSSGSDNEAPSDSDARQTGDEFMSDLKDEFYSLAWLTLCDAGRTKFSGGSALQKELGLTNKKVTDYTIQSVKPSTFNGDPRKEVNVKVTYSTGSGETLQLSITMEDGDAKVCGF